MIFFIEENKMVDTIVQVIYNSRPTCGVLNKLYCSKINPINLR